MVKVNAHDSIWGIRLFGCFPFHWLELKTELISVLTLGMPFSAISEKRKPKIYKDYTRHHLTMPSYSSQADPTEIRMSGGILLYVMDKIG